MHALAEINTLRINGDTSKALYSTHENLLCLGDTFPESKLRDFLQLTNTMLSLYAQLAAEQYTGDRAAIMLFLSFSAWDQLVNRNTSLHNFGSFNIPNENRWTDINRSRAHLLLLGWVSTGDVIFYQSALEILRLAGNGVLRSEQRAQDELAYFETKIPPIPPTGIGYLLGKVKRDKKILAIASPETQPSHRSLWRCLTISQTISKPYIARLTKALTKIAPDINV